MNLRSSSVTGLLLFALLRAGYGAQFPAIEGETLSGAHLALPGGAQGKTTLLIIGFTQGSARQTSEWSRRAPKEANAWSVSVLEDVPRLIRGVIVHGIKASVPKDKFDHFLVVYKNEKEVREAAQCSQPDDACLVLLAPGGAIEWRYHGPVTDAAMNELRSRLH